MKLRNWLCALIGVWFIISPWALGKSGEVGLTWTSVIVGAIQVVVSAWAAIARDVPGYKLWQNWVSFACGFWFVFHPFLTHFEIGPFWSVVVSGLVTMALNLWTLMLNPDGSRPDAHAEPDPTART
ncbi:MAG: SPW repeat protein [Alicyclobacillus sp.]|nr:SPW repeat protein [Alicyclobacillus sp.]